MLGEGGAGLFDVRFMDDILVLSPTRWRLRKAVKVVNQVLGPLCNGNTAVASIDCQVRQVDTIPR